MNLKQNWVAFQTLITKEVTRFLRVWTQTILPSAITMALYFIIFGHLMGSRIGTLNGIPYIQYIAPGLIMMSVITNAYSNVTSSFFLAKFQRSIEELLVSPTPNYLILGGFVMGAVLRGLIVGIVVTLISALFTDLTVHHFLIMALVVFLAALLFSLAGFINGIFAKKFDDIAIIPTFILTPLTYLGGVFYSVSMLPPIWRTLSYFNPILYMVNAFRYGVLGVSDVNIGLALAIITGMIIVLLVLALYLLDKGVGIRT
ncbi:MAG: ABC transporter permease [Gammaproteobacteria bacterium]|nr:ABC transporter permease [Gammaproteobacteria bacterium]